MKRLLWIDDEPWASESRIDELRRTGYTVEVARSLTDAERALEVGDFYCVVLDVMIPTSGDEEHSRYPPSSTASGFDSGAAFFDIWKPHLSSRKLPLVAVTSRWDMGIKERFLRSGLPENRFLRFSMFDDARAFVEALESAIASDPSEGES